MKLANLAGRASLIGIDGTAHDVHRLSAGKWGPDASALYADWDAFGAWAAEAGELAGGTVVDPALLGAPSPQPRQILAFGLNYAAHAAESGFDAPADLPPVFPKFVSSLSGPDTTVVIPAGAKMDWEVELVAIIGRAIDHPITEDEAWDYVAGVTAGQDLSDRSTQFSTPAPQFGLGKSFPGFAPTGPHLVTVDELADPNDVSLRCTLDGEVMQEGSTAKLLVSIPRLLVGLSGIVSLYPGDLVFTGTPQGVGVGRDPQVFIQPGQELITTIGGVGELRQTFVAAGTDGAPDLRALPEVGK